MWNVRSVHKHIPWDISRFSSSMTHTIFFVATSHTWHLFCANDTNKTNSPFGENSKSEISFNPNSVHTAADLDTEPPAPPTAAVAVVGLGLTDTAAGLLVVVVVVVVGVALGRGTVFVVAVVGLVVVVVGLLALDDDVVGLLLEVEVVDAEGGLVVDGLVDGRVVEGFTEVADWDWDRLLPPPLCFVVVVCCCVNWSHFYCS